MTSKNHDYEGLKLIQSALEALGITLLCDEKTAIQTGYYLLHDW